MNYLIDTDICIYILNENNPKLKTRFQEKTQSRFCVSSITEAELYYGALHSAKPKSNLEKIELFLSPLEKIYFDSMAAKHFAYLKEHLVKIGKPIGAPDMFIAASALAHDLTLISNNEKHFQNIPKLKFENWNTP
ncbi:MAG: type II toxin-antitoxin system VapC family toxin [Deltaproteobacteria bacterium]|nr:type II toxin-antitoxin system VapC family toxin [Deltaproteobacteria bacterium]